ERPLDDRADRLAAGQVVYFPWPLGSTEHRIDSVDGVLVPLRDLLLEPVGVDPELFRDVADGVAANPAVAALGRVLRLVRIVGERVSSHRRALERLERVSVPDHEAGMVLPLVRLWVEAREHAADVVVGQCLVDEAPTLAVDEDLADVLTFGAALQVR